jgi:hypothetical protein
MIGGLTPVYLMKVLDPCKKRNTSIHDIVNILIENESIFRILNAE